MKTIEKSYSFVFKNVLRAVNPLKKKVMTTECEVHQFINNQALHILRSDGFEEEYALFSNYIEDINSGGIWADQDFKSSNHFYNPYNCKGLYGNSNAMRECILYYTKALNSYFKGNIKNSMFYLGAVNHLIQDMTVPQHVNLKLLDNHRKYELWVIEEYTKHDIFKSYNDGIYLDTIKEFIDFNSKSAIKTYERHENEPNSCKKFYNITCVQLVIAQKTTAGIMKKFHKDILKIKRDIINRDNIINKIGTKL
ncbi:zinc dependent phospholipase C family protein [Clostridium cylindrosporum]|uniref:Phospholipase C n=1 Tax=Clostridium cylindrosporum DSM 605 TaxID=1121307 RepID=A0A0J8G4V9_CLOCY|nr:zinc dependent phospholipase C family protein [Clostridium cylindrosporum]KMT22711.1 zinc dependent phospholipase C [Clostridium cylindrosporum DSM 605]